MSKPTKCRGPVVLDTSFLITLASKAREHHVSAKRYFAYWTESRTPMFLPAICVAEYLALDASIPKNILCHVVVKPFTYEDAVCAAKLLREGVLSRTGDEIGVRPSRVLFKDDVKIIGCALSLRAAAIVTEDERTMCKYVEVVRKNAAEARGLLAVSIRGGFNRGLAELDSPDLGIV